MNANHSANRKLWTNALRSGLYKQTVGSLKHKDYGYCCLGVACEVYQREVGDLVIKDCPGERLSSYDDNTHFLPEKVIDWLGLTTKDGGFKDGTLAFLNDHRSSFEAIADLIESNPEGLFV